MSLDNSNQFSSSRESELQSTRCCSVHSFLVAHWIWKHPETEGEWKCTVWTLFWLELLSLPASSVYLMCLHAFTYLHGVDRPAPLEDWVSDEVWDELFGDILDCYRRYHLKFSDTVTRINATDTGRIKSFYMGILVIWGEVLCVLFCDVIISALIIDI